MARTPSDPSGVAKPITLRLSPAAIELLDHHAEVRGLTRSQLVTNVLGRLTEPAGAAVPARHPRNGPPRAIPSTRAFNPQPKASKS